MKLTLDISVQEVEGFPQTMLTVMTETKVVSIPFEKKLTLDEILSHANKGEANQLPPGSVIWKKEGESNEDAILRARKNKYQTEIVESVPYSEVKRRVIETPMSHAELEATMVLKTDGEPPPPNQPKVGDFNPNEIQREDLIQIQNVMSGLKDASGNELVKREGIKSGGVYRVLKINQNIITTPDPANPDGEPIMTKIVNSYEVIDDKAPRPERLSVFPSECVLFKKREKKISIVKPVFSELLKCANCGEVNAFVLKGNKFEGVCPKCNEKNSIERVIELCQNEKCVDAGKARSKVACYLYDGKFTGVCGTCKTSVEKELVA